MEGPDWYITLGAIFGAAIIISFIGSIIIVNLPKKKK